MRSVLAFSIALNLLLVTSIVVARVDLSRSGTRPTAAVPSDRRAEGARPTGSATADAGSLAGYYRALRTHGLSHEETYVPLAGRALRVLTVGSGPDAPYWRSAPADEARGERRAELEGRLRRELEALYGEEAAARPELAMLFRPLGPGFESMSSPQQLAVVAAQRARLAEAGPANFVGAGPGREAAEKACHGPKSQASDWMNDLDAATRFELALRTSPLAARLRTADLDEPQFRAAFAVLERFASAASVDAQRAARGELEDLLGRAQSDRLLRELDPAYRRLAALLSDAGVAPGPIDAAYAIVANARDAMLDEIGARGAGTPAADGRDTARLAAIARDETEQLAGLLGPELAGQIVGRRGRLQAAAAAPRAACAG